MWSPAALSATPSGGRGGSGGHPATPAAAPEAAAAEPTPAAPTAATASATALRRRQPGRGQRTADDGSHPADTAHSTAANTNTAANTATAATAAERRYRSRHRGGRRGGLALTPAAVGDDAATSKGSSGGDTRQRLALHELSFSVLCLEHIEASTNRGEGRVRRRR